MVECHGLKANQLTLINIVFNESQNILLNVNIFTTCFAQCGRSGIGHSNRSIVQYRSQYLSEIEQYKRLHTMFVTNNHASFHLR